MIERSYNFEAGSSLILTNMGWLCSKNWVRDEGDAINFEDGRGGGDVGDVYGGLEGGGAISKTVICWTW